MTNAIKITPAFAIELQTNSWVIINQDYAVGAYKSRQAARDAKAADKLEGSIKNKSEVEFEIVVPAVATPVVAAPVETEKKLLPNAAEILKQNGCPYCGDLHNGVTYDDKPGKETQYVFCHICGTSFSEIDGHLRSSKAKATPKKTNGPILHKSEIDHPCKRVWGIAEDMKKANANVKRGEVLAACVEQGIAYYTARTQYQQWLGIQKEMAARKAAQAK